MSKTVAFIVFMSTLAVLAGLYFRFQGNHQHKQVVQEQTQPANPI